MNKQKHLSPKELEYEYRTILDRPRFTWIASLGQIVSGYSLLFAKQPMLNFTQLQAKDYYEFTSIFKLIIECTCKCYGDVAIFEHGAVIASSSVGCGVDQAHLHIVPINGSLILKELNQKYTKISEHSSFISGLEANTNTPYPYILHCDINEKTSIFSYGKKRESQAVRKILWQITKSRSHWNWKVSPTVAEAIKTKELLNDAIKCRIH